LPFGRLSQTRTSGLSLWSERQVCCGRGNRSRCYSRPDLGATAISPDDRWLAYTSAASGHFEIYVMPFSPQGNTMVRKWLVSNEGGFAPVWSRNSRELFYEGLDSRVEVARLRVIRS
jgi:Tol biopolymer transport system component